MEQLMIDTQEQFTDEQDGNGDLGLNGRRIARLEIEKLRERLMNLYDVKVFAPSENLKFWKSHIIKNWRSIPFILVLEEKQ